MDLVLSPETQKLLEQRMSRGGYKTPEEAVRAGLAYLEQQEQTGDFAPGELNRLLAEADADIERGDLIDGERFVNSANPSGTPQDEKVRRHRPRPP